MSFVFVQNHTKEQEEEWYKLVIRAPIICFSIAEAANKYMEDNNLDTRAAFAHAIHFAKKKLNGSGPILDDVEYHEIIKAQEIMDELVDV